MKKILLYEKNQFFNYKREQIEKNVPIYSMSEFLSNTKIMELDKDKECVIDISSLVGVMKKDDSQIFNAESLLNMLGDNVIFICDEVYKDDLIYMLRHVFDETKDLEVERDEKFNKQEDGREKKVVTKITDISLEKKEEFFKIFEQRLFGHEVFKKEFHEIVDSFRVFNKLGEHKILSLFLMGDSGVGKTEVARAIYSALGGAKNLAKINFGNYSSHDALNSLIGSPLGYIGSDGGELIKRVKASDVGVILIDEFEKADTAVFNYFLDVLENGKIVNSQAEEIDINGYIIVFTSNMTKTEFQSKISPELRSRFDYKGNFGLLKEEDKNAFMLFRINQIIEKYKTSTSSNIPVELCDTIANKIDVTKYKNMRDLNKKIKDTFVDEIKTL